jgi:hypothetical protein
MNKIPVFGTVSRAYGFLIGDFITILRLVWAPLLAAAALQYYYGPAIMDAAARTMQTADPTRMMENMPTQWLLGIAQFVAGIIALVALLRVVISGDRKPGLFVYFWFGSAEIRIVVVTVLLIVASVAAFFGAIIILALLGALAAAVPVLGLLLFIGGVILIFVLIWIALRLSLISPVIVAESGLGVERSWALMQGNALRMFLVVLLTFVPLAVAAIIVFSVLLGSDFPAFPNFLALMKPAGGDAQSATAVQAAVNEAMKHWQSALFEAYRKHWTEISVFGFIYSIISTALGAGVTGSAYVSASGKNG